MSFGLECRRRGNDKPFHLHVAFNYLYPKGLLLFNLDEDIGETTDLAAQHPEVVATLTKLRTGWRAQMGKPSRPAKKK
jgi:hypothetical protein